MNEDLLSAKIEDCYKSVKSVESDKDKVFDIHVERLSYLVLTAGQRLNGSKRLDVILSRIQKESPTLPVPRFVMSTAELEKLIDNLATDDTGDHVYSAYRRKARSMSELIAEAKKTITERSGFMFDPTVRAIRSQ